MLKIKVIAKSICSDERLSQYVVEKLGLTNSEIADPELCRDPDYLSHFVQDAQAVLFGHQEFDAAFFHAHPDLKYIAKYGVGIDNVDQSVIEACAVKLLFEPGVNKSQVAGHTLALILNALHNVSVSDRLLRTQRWHRDGGRSLYGKTVGIVGFGNVGAALADLLRPFEVNLLVNDILNKTEEASQRSGFQVDLETLLRRSDVVSMHVPLTDETRAMCDHEFYSKMKSDGLFVNASRGKVVVESDLLETLNSHAHFQAALDVFQEEPTQNHELINHDRVLATPHIAANSIEAKLAMVDAAIKLLKSVTE